MPPRLPHAVAQSRVVSGPYASTPRRVSILSALLAVCVGAFLTELSNELPMTLDFSLWYSSGFFALLLVTAGLLAYGFRISLAGRSMFADSALDG